MERQGATKLQQAVPGSIIVESRRHANQPAPRTPKDLRKVRMEEQWDVGSLDALRGYAPLARDATTARELDWRHLKHESKGDTMGLHQAADASDTAKFRPASPGYATPEVLGHSRIVSLDRIGTVNKICLHT
jgi:hypothetical protein